MNDKIDRDIIAIVWRFMWQSKINDLNEEYHSIFICNEKLEYVLETRLQIGDDVWNIGGPPTGFYDTDPLCAYNFRDMELLHRDIISEWWRDYYTEISNLNFLTMEHVFVGTMSENPQLENYAYSSTKGLREIKKNNIKCL